VLITYIGHATLLLEIGDVRVITDPNYEQTLGGFLPRVTAPGIALESLPRLDAILLTHAHFDHLSFKTLDRLPRDIPLFAPPSIARWLVSKGYRHAMPLEASKQALLGSAGRVRLHAAAATHEGSRYAIDRWRSAANMYLIESDEESIFFAGDTALTPETHHLVDRVLWASGRSLDIALLPIGHAPPWKEQAFRKGHLTETDALALFEILGARVMLPYHWGTFRHVTAGAHDAIRRLREVLATHHRREEVHIVEPGESLFVDASSARHIHRA
jgi:L-ascorbate metabolism protein UlaG (beta-lactamase superfamily)